MVKRGTKRNKDTQGAGMAGQPWTGGEEAQLWQEVLSQFRQVLALLTQALEAQVAAKRAVDETAVAEVLRVAELMRKAVEKLVALETVKVVG